MKLLVSAHRLCFTDFSKNLTLGYFLLLQVMLLRQLISFTWLYYYLLINWMWICSDFFVLFFYVFIICSLNTIGGWETLLSFVFILKAGVWLVTDSISKENVLVNIIFTPLTDHKAIYSSMRFSSFVAPHHNFWKMNILHDSVKLQHKLLPLIGIWHKRKEHFVDTGNF